MMIWDIKKGKLVALRQFFSVPKLEGRKIGSSALTKEKTFGKYKCTEIVVIGDGVGGGEAE